MSTFLPEQVDILVSMYSAGKSVDEIADALQKPKKSIITKLSLLKLYKTNPKPVYNVPTKQTYVKEIESILGVALPSIYLMKLDDIKTLLDRIKNLK